VSTAIIGTQNALIFETTSDLWIYGDGIISSLTATGNGNANQQFVLGDPTKPWPTYVFTGGSGTQVVTVGSTTYTLAPGNSLAGQAAGATMYTVVNGNTVMFGGGTAANPGAVPANGSAISITYSPTVITGGSPAAQYSATVNAIHGQSNTGEGIGISDGTPNQQYTLFNTPVVDGSVSVYVDEGNGPTPWIYHQRLVDAFSSEAAYTLSVDANGVVTVSFGDNIAGRIPAPGAFVTADYMVGGGAIGNTAANSLTQVQVGPFSIVGVTNTVPATGGADAETLDHIRIHAPMSITAISRAVTLDDYAALVLNIPSIAKAAAISTAYNAVNIYIHPAGNFILSPIPSVPPGQPPGYNLINRVNALIPSITNSAYTGYMDDKKMVGVSINILPPQYNLNGVLQAGYVPINVTATIQVLPQYHQSTVQSAAQAAIQNLLLFSVVDFGWRVTLSSVYHTLMQVEGIDWVNVNVLCRNEVTPQTTADVQCAAYEIPQAYNIVVNANGGVLY
jgi:predicted phage baseplate assembly protein